MSTIISYERELNLMSPRKWENYLKQHSGWPHANIPLARAFARTGTLIDFKKFIQLQPYKAPENTPDAFLVLCGVFGLGHCLSKYHDEGLFLKLKKLSNDSRPSIRKAVVRSLRTIGKKKFSRLAKSLQSWTFGSYLEQRAVAISVSDPRLLKTKSAASQALDMLDCITVHLMNDEYQDKGFRLLRKDLANCWSIAVMFYPQKGKLLLERWIKEGDQNINLVMNESLKKLRSIEPEWTGIQLSKLSV